MKFSLTSSAVLALSTSTAIAHAIQSAPFQLVLSNRDRRYNNRTLFACHEGAAIEGLCVGSTYGSGTRPDTFQFNTTVGQLDTSGILTYELRGGNFNFSEGMRLIIAPSSNVGHAQFQPGYGSTLVNFDSANRLNIQDYVDDTVNPVKVGNETSYYRWYICQTYTQGYNYTTLNWAYGKNRAQNPTCVSTNVTRVFV